MTISILPRLKKGANADNIASGRGVLYAGDTWAVSKLHGFTHIRIPVGMIDIVPGAGSTPAHIAATLARLDTTVQALQANGFAISLCPFGSGVLPNVDIISAALDILTKRYAPMAGPDTLAFELRNEPHQFTVDQWNAAVARLLAEIRINAPLHTVIIPPVRFDNLEALPALALVDDPNVVYTFHFYEPAQLTQQGVGGGPPNPAYVFPAPLGTPGKTGFYTIEKLNARIALAAAWATQHNVPIMMGEFGCPVDALTTTALQPGVAQCVWAKAVVAGVKLCPSIIGMSWWSIDGREFGVRPHNLSGAWNEPLLEALDAA